MAFGASLACYVLGLPLGLHGLDATAATTGQLVWGHWLAAAASPLAVLLARPFLYLPVGDLATRSHLATAVWGATAVALVAVFAAERMRALRPAPHARQTSREFAHEPVAVLAAGGVMLLTPGAFDLVTRAGSASLSLVLVMAGWLALMRLRRTPHRHRWGLGLALLVGIAFAAGGVTALLLGLPATLLVIWALRRGERWPLLAPVVTMAGLGSLLLLVAPLGSHDRSSLRWEEIWHRLSLHDVARALTPVPRRDVLALLVREGEQIGVLGQLVGGVGLVVLILRTPLGGLLASWGLAMGSWAGACSSDTFGQTAGTGVLIVTAVAAVVVALGVAHLAGKLGAARLPAAVVLTVTLLVGPLLETAALRRDRQPGLAEWLMAEGLRRAPPATGVDPGSPPMEVLFGYAAALGLRPDLTFLPRPSGHRP